MMMLLVIGVILFLGVFAGHILRKIAAEEIHEGKTYFAFAQVVCKVLLIFMIVLQVARTPSLQSIIVFVVGVLVGKFVQASFLYQGSAGAAAYGSLVFVWVIGLVWVRHLLYGSLEVKKMSASLLVSAVLFIIPFAVVEFVPPSFTEMWLPFAAGALVMSK